MDRNVMLNYNSTHWRGSECVKIMNRRSTDQQSLSVFDLFYNTINIIYYLAIDVCSKYDTL